MDIEKPTLHFDECIFFIHKRLAKWADIDESILSGKVDDVLLKIEGGRDAWIINTYVRLKSQGQNVKLVADFVQGAICVAHSDDIPPQVGPSNAFVVAIRADRERNFLCELEVVQSPAAIESRRSILMQHWSQPGLVPRAVNRGNDLKKVGFFGVRRNLSASFRSDEFSRSIAELGLEFVIRDSFDAWSNYSDIDAVIAIRDGSPSFLAAKPATKLINAWLAGVPAFVGKEPAYSHLRCNEFDFIRADNAEEVIDGLRMLKQRPEIYDRFRAQGQVRAREFSADVMTDCWSEFFLAQVFPRYARWREHRGIISVIDRRISFGWRLLRRKLRGYTYTRGVDIDGNRVVRTRSWLRRMAWRIDRVITKWEGRHLVF